MKEQQGYTRRELWPINCDDSLVDLNKEDGSMQEESNERSEMDELKIQIKLDSRRHSNKLIRKLMSAGVELNELIEDRIHQEVCYASLDAFRATMKFQSEKETYDDDYENRFNR